MDREDEKGRAQLNSCIREDILNENYKEIPFVNILANSFVIE